MRYHADLRAERYCDLFSTFGDVNLFVVRPGQRTCWHRHRFQRDEFRVIQGKIRFGAFDNRWRAPGYRWISTADELVTVEPGLWHGYANETDRPAMLLMYLSTPYNPTDEERMSEDEVPWHPV